LRREKSTQTENKKMRQKRKTEKGQSRVILAREAWGQGFGGPKEGSRNSAAGRSK
jgi:hypothetical protein